jgi:hypothetical protein
MKRLLSIHWVLVVSAWYTIMGILHDIFVLKKHHTHYDRELLRLLTTGHILLFSGIMLIVCYRMLYNKHRYGAVIGIIVGIAMLIYCIMIFPFLKSFGTIAVSIILILVCSSVNIQLKHTKQNPGK